LPAASSLEHQIVCPINHRKPDVVQNKYVLSSKIVRIDDLDMLIACPEWVSHMDVANHNQTGRLIGRALDRPQGESHGRLESQIVRIDDLDMLIACPEWVSYMDVANTIRQEG